MKGLVFEAERLAPPGELAADLLAGEARELFPGHAFEDVEDVHPRPDCMAGTLPAEVFHCVSSAGRERLEAVRTGTGVVVTTGQQPQLFGGPSYVLYKGLTAVRAATEIERRTGTPCLAVFWVAADDHDWREVASVGFLDREEQVRGLRVSPPADRAGRSVGPSPLPGSIESLTGEYLDALETGPAGAPWMGELRDAYVPGRSFTEAFIRVASSWFRGLPIAFLDAAHPEVRRASIPLMSEVIERRGEVRAALGRGTAAVREKGYTPQLTHIEPAVPVFRDTGDERFRLRAGADGIQIDPRGRRSSARELVAELEADPARFSASAALRPALESWLLPVAQTVLGPGEVGYWAQLGPLFRLVEVEMPAIRPRDSWRVIETRVQRLLDKVGIGAEEARDLEAARRRIIARNRPTVVEESLKALEDRVTGEYGTLASAVDAELPGLRSAVGKSRKRTIDSIRELRGTVDRSVADREAIVLGQLDRIATHLYPGGRPQERGIAASVFIARHGRDFLDAARSAAGIDSGGDASPSADGVAGAPPQE